MWHAWLRRSDTRVVAILCLVVGTMSLDQVGINFLMPFIKPDLHLQNTQVGLLVSAYWVAFAISSYGSSFLAEAVGKRKAFLTATLVLFSLCAVVPSFVTSFGGLLAARLVMGLLEGPMMPLAQSIIALESPIERRGTYMGIVGNLGGPILGLFVAPLLLVKLASLYGWRSGFLVIPAPGLLCALLVARFVPEPAVEKSVVSGAQTPAAPGGRLAEVLRFRNVYLCGLLCCCYLAFINLGFAFLPLFYINVKQFSPQEMSFLMGLLGIAAALSGVLLPTLSERIGRRPVMVLSGALGITFPLVALYFVGPLTALALLLCVTWAFSGTPSIFTATIPSETVPARSISTAMGLIIGVGTIGGGFAGPAIAGWSADRWGLQAALLIQAGCAAAAALAAAGLRETAPKRIKAPAVAAQV